MLPNIYLLRKEAFSFFLYNRKPHWWSTTSSKLFQICTPLYLNVFCNIFVLASGMRYFWLCLVRWSWMFILVINMSLSTGGIIPLITLNIIFATVNSYMSGKNSSSCDLNIGAVCTLQSADLIILTHLFCRTRIGLRLDSLAVPQISIP